MFYVYFIVVKSKYWQKGLLKLVSTLSKGAIKKANDRSRTDDRIITSDVLYQLSYVGFSAGVPPYSLSYLCKAEKNYMERLVLLSRLKTNQLTYNGVIPRINSIIMT